VAVQQAVQRVVQQAEPQQVELQQVTRIHFQAKESDPAFPGLAPNAQPAHLVIVVRSKRFVNNNGALIF
jgi:hypothetical protein